MANKVKVDLGSNSYNITMIGDFKDSVKRFASSTKSQCMLITQKNIFDLYKKQFDELSNISNIDNLKTTLQCFRFFVYSLTRSIVKQVLETSTFHPNHPDD